MPNNENTNTKHEGRSANMPEDEIATNYKQEQLLNPQRPSQSRPTTPAAPQRNVAEMQRRICQQML